MTTRTTDTSEAALPLHRFTTETYHRMGDAGFFEEHPVELIDGQIVDMGPINSKHAGVVIKLNKLLSGILPDDYLLHI